MNVRFLYVPFDLKEEAKKLGAQYDKDLKSWYCEIDNNDCLEEFDVRFFEIDYDKDVVDILKNNYCRWDKNRKQWYSYCGNSIIDKYIKK